MKILVCGSRYWTDRLKIFEELKKYPPDTILVHGGCKGADLVSADICKSFGWEVREYRANWNKYGKSAGPRRNRQMVSCENPDVDGIKIDLVTAPPPSFAWWGSSHTASRNYLLVAGCFPSQIN